MTARDRLAASLLPPPSANPLLPRWLGPVFIGVAAFLVPWTIWLLVSLPEDAEANHWRYAWAGFDLAMTVGLVLTAVTFARRSPMTAFWATGTGAALLCDAWFDVMTARTTGDVVLAVVAALCAEIPIVVLCFWYSRKLLHAFEVVVPHLQTMGFRVEHHRLIPPERLGDEG